MEEGLLKKLMATIKCSVCGHGYEAGSINVVGREKDLWFLKALCSSCHTECLVAAVIKENKVSEVISDLTEVELKRFSEKGELTLDDVLALHNFLKDFDGDFQQLFGRN